MQLLLIFETYRYMAVMHLFVKKTLYYNICPLHILFLKVKKRMAKTFLFLFLFLPWANSENEKFSPQKKSWLSSHGSIIGRRRRRTN